MLRAILMCFVVVFLSVPGLAQESKSEGAPSAADDTELSQDELEFNEAIAEFGKLAGAAYACSKDEDLAEGRRMAFEIYSDILNSFGAEKAFVFSAYFGFGTGETNDEKKCVEVIDQFTDKYGAVIGKRELVDGPPGE